MERVFACSRQCRAWRGNEIAVTSDTAIGTIPATGRSVTVICREPRVPDYGSELGGSHDECANPLRHS